MSIFWLSLSIVSLFFSAVFPSVLSIYYAFPSVLPFIMHSYLFYASGVLIFIAR